VVYNKTGCAFVGMLINISSEESLTLYGMCKKGLWEEGANLILLFKAAENGLGPK
jgi:hypothetical protein